MYPGGGCGEFPDTEGIEGLRLGVQTRDQAAVSGAGESGDSGAFTADARRILWTSIPK